MGKDDCPEPKLVISNIHGCFFADGAIVLLYEPPLNAVEVKVMPTFQLPKIIFISICLLQNDVQIHSACRILPTKKT